MSVVVAARNAEPTLAACLTSLQALDYPAFDVIVVDDGSRDATATIAEAAGAVVMLGPGRGAGSARNVAIHATTSDIVAFTDADCTVPPHWLRALVGGLRQPSVAGAGGRQRNVFPAATAAGSDAADAFDAFFRAASVVSAYTRTDDRMRRVNHVASCNSAYWRDALLDVGGFADDFWPGEDVDLDHRLRQRGYGCLYVPAAEVRHHRPGTVAWFRTMMRRYGGAERALVRRHGRFRLIHVVPVATGVAAAAQLLWLSAPARPLVASLDLAAIVVGIGLVTVSAAPRHWGRVAGYAALALWEWHRGWWTAKGTRA
ncbi:MAG: glycosyltransferase [Vicinamibacterales bacterium]